MTTYSDLQKFLLERDYRLIIAADAEPIVHKKQRDTTITKTPAGGVSVALEPIAKAARAIFIGRGKTAEDKEVADKNGKIEIGNGMDGHHSEPVWGSYTLKRVFLSEQETYDYYYGFSNQTLWPLCHVAFERPVFSSEWWKGYQEVNKKFAESIKQEIKAGYNSAGYNTASGRKKTLVWINDYQLTMVPHYLGKIKDVTLAMFWHIPWPTWEIFRILPQKKEILESMLMCDYIAFHRRYQRRNFSSTVERELEGRSDPETNRIYYNNHVTTVNSLPMGIDTDVIKNIIDPEPLETLFQTHLQATEEQTGKQQFIESLFKDTKVLLGVDRLDYTKGLLLRLQALDLFFDRYPQYREKVTYVGITAPSRQEIPSYLMLRKQLLTHAAAINKKYATNTWQPINLLTATFSRKDVMDLYRKAAVCLVTPLDDGMNLVSKEFIIASSMAKNPGMLVLSQFAGSAIDLAEAIIVNPYNMEEVSEAIKTALEMPRKEKDQRIQTMAQTLEHRNVYEWGEKFLQEAELSGRENAK